MTKAEKAKGTKSKLPILIGAIVAPVLVYVTLSQVLGTALNPAQLDLQGLLTVGVVPAILGALIGLISSRRAKTEAGAIWFTVIGIVVVGAVCLICGLLFVFWIFGQLG
jgi:hypothetical protein